MANPTGKNLQQPNHNDVPAKQWNRWCDLAQRTFNSMMALMETNQDLFLHPKAVPSRPKHWRTTCWNAAWSAADAVQAGLKDISKGRGYKH